MARMPWEARRALMRWERREQMRKPRPDPPAWSTMVGIALGLVVAWWVIARPDILSILYIIGTMYISGPR